MTSGEQWFYIRKAVFFSMPVICGDVAKPYWTLSDENGICYSVYDGARDF